MRCWSPLLAAAVLGLGAFLSLGRSPLRAGSAPPPAAPVKTDAAALPAGRGFSTRGVASQGSPRAFSSAGGQTTAAPRASRQQSAAPVGQGFLARRGAPQASAAVVGNCTTGGWTPRSVNNNSWSARWPSSGAPEMLWQSPWDLGAVKPLVPPEAQPRGLTSGCVATREWNASGGSTIEELEHPAAKTYYRSRCWDLTKSAPCQSCCGQTSCFAGNRQLKNIAMGSSGRTRVGLAMLQNGVDVYIDPGGRLFMEPPMAHKFRHVVGMMVDTWGLQWHGPPAATVNFTRMDRRIILIPIKYYTVRAMRENFGHWLSSIFVPTLLAAWGAKGAVWPILLPGCGARSSRCRSSTVFQAYYGYGESLRSLPERMGLPWLRELSAPPASLEEATGGWRLYAVCERCPPQERLAAAMPQLRQWLAHLYPSLTFEPSRPPARRLVLLNRRRHGARWISNAHELAEVGSAMGVASEVLDVAAPCSYGGQLAAQLNAADIVIGFNGADLGFAAVLQRPGSALVEVIDRVYAYQDAWELFQGRFGSDLRVLRLVLSHESITYHADTRDALAEHKQVAARTRQSLSQCSPEFNRSFNLLCWRFLPSTVAVPVHLWRQLLSVVSNTGQDPEVQAVQRPTPVPVPPAPQAAPRSPSGPRRARRAGRGGGTARIRW
eukprot:TRINITY_DN33706_c0_g1_i1.p1 TRINITY_DN33706_c0_g1~~TRINITY_DN33706_c0_g1_i1.p1  ORF type:complete len:662 (+),score=40.94 TRINITY_DN33706_c0_g1_i1:90-2075(+)